MWHEKQSPSPLFLALHSLETQESLFRIRAAHDDRAPASNSNQVCTFYNVRFQKFSDGQIWYLLPSQQLHCGLTDVIQWKERRFSGKLP